MARVIALVPDLLFGSKVQSMLARAGHEVELVNTEFGAAEQLAGCDVLVVDLTTDEIDGTALVATLRDGDRLGRTRALAFYSHVDVEVRARALRAGFDVVVPRSRMAREGAAVVAGLLDGDQSRPGPGT